MVLATRARIDARMSSQSRAKRSFSSWVHGLGRNVVMGQEATCATSPGRPGPEKTRGVDPSRMSEPWDCPSGLLQNKGTRSWFFANIVTELREALTRLLAQS